MATTAKKSTRKKTTAYSRMLKGRCSKNAAKLRKAYVKQAKKSGKSTAEIKKTVSRVMKMTCNK